MKALERCQAKDTRIASAVFRLAGTAPVAVVGPYVPLRYRPLLSELTQKSNLIASCSCLGVMIERGKPKAFAGKAGNNVKVLFAELAVKPRYWLTFTNEKYPPPGASPVLARFQILKPSSINRSLVVSLVRIVRVMRVSDWKTAGVLKLLRAKPGTRSSRELPSRFKSAPTCAEYAKPDCN